MKRLLSIVSSVAACATVGLAYAAERVDAENETGNTWQPLNWSATRDWRGYAPAGGGGIATFTQGGKLGNDRGASFEYFQQNVTDLTLRALKFGNFISWNFYGNPIKFVGGAPYINATRTDGDHKNLMILNVELQGDGSNSLAKKDGGRLIMNKPLKNMASFDLVGGSVVITNTTGDDVLGANGVPVKVVTGGLSYEPDEAEASAKIGKVIVGDGIGFVTVKNGGTLTADALEKVPGGVLNVNTSDSGKFLVAGKSSVTAPDGGMVHLPLDGTVQFLDYDETEGWKAGTSIPSNAKVFGSTSDAANAVNETGALTFANEGYVWRPAVKGNATLKVTGRINAPGGVTFITGPDNEFSAHRSNLDFSNVTEISSPVRFIGMMASGIVPSTFTAGTDVSVCGDKSDIDKAGLIIFDAQKHKNTPFTFNLHLSGAGDNYGFVSNGGDWQFKQWIQDGKTILEGDTTLASGGGNLLVFNGEVSGRGGMRISSGHVRFCNAGNSFAGDLQLDGSSSVNVLSKGKLGSGDIYMTDSSSRLYFSKLAEPQVVTAAFLGTGTNGQLAVQKSTVELTRGASVKTTYVQDGATLKLGKDLKTNHVYLDHDSAIFAKGGDVKLVTTSTANSALAGRLADGEDGEKLSLVKNGAETLVVCGTNNTYSGVTQVNAGTLKLGGSLFNASDVSWWIDAADESTITFSEDGRISTVRSKVGSLKFTGDLSDKKAPPPEYVTNDGYFNNNNFFRFSPVHGNTTQFWDYCPRLTASGSAETRTVFIVCRTKTGVDVTHQQGALIGYSWQDVSLRINTDGWIPTQQTESQDFWPTAGYGRQNGVVKSGFSTVAIEGANVIGVFVTSHLIPGGGYNHYSSFTPLIGDNGSRPWAGDLGEIIAFKRVLTPAECCSVENYLMAKWNPTRTTQHTAEECWMPTKNYLPVATDLQIANGATLDLNGTEQTVANLSGEGTVSNSSDKAATLIVTEGGDFRGRVIGNVTLVLPSGSRQVVMRNGAKLVVAGATDATIEASNPQPPTHDLAFWLDASKRETLEMDATENITRWNCREQDKCVVKSFYYSSGTHGSYDEKGWNEGKPAVFLNATDMFYLSNTTTDMLTLFYVTKLRPGKSNYIFGPNGQDVGMLSYTDNSGYTINCRGPSWLNSYGDLLHINGVDRTNEKTPSYWFSHTAYPWLVYVMRASDKHAAEKSHLRNVTWCLGSHSGTRASVQYVAEIIGYTKQLTDAEIAATEKYLMDKWANSSTEWPEQETVAYDESCGLGVAGGATLDLGAKDVTLSSLGGNGGKVKTSGSLTVNDAITLMVNEGKVDTITVEGNLALGSQAVAQLINGEGLDGKYPLQRALTVTGEVTGGNLAKIEGLPRKWSWSRAGNTWTIGRNGIMVIIK